MTTITIDPAQCRALGIDPEDAQVVLPDGFEKRTRQEREAWALEEIVRSTCQFWAEIYGVGLEEIRAALGDDFRRFIGQQIQALRKAGADRE